MRYKEIIKESVDISACELKDNRITPHNQRQEEAECDICDGTGVIDYQSIGSKELGPDKWSCGMCRGTGKITEWVCDGPEMNISNMNAAVIVRQIFGQEWDDMGMVSKEQLPSLRKKLFKMVNMESERSSMHQDPSREQGPMRRIKGEDGIDRIGRGATMISGGRPDSQVLGYATRLLDMVDYAMKNDLIISWG